MFLIAKEYKQPLIMVVMVMVLFMALFSLSGVAFADDPVCIVPDWSANPFLDLLETIYGKFPFSLVAWAVNLFADMENISPISPGEMCFDFIIFSGVCPLSFLDLGVFDDVMHAVRWLMLILIALGLTKHVMEVIL